MCSCIECGEPPCQKNGGYGTHVQYRNCFQHYSLKDLQNHLTEFMSGEVESLASNGGRVKAEKMIDVRNTLSEKMDGFRENNDLKSSEFLSNILNFCDVKADELRNKDLRKASCYIMVRLETYQIKESI